MKKHLFYSLLSVFLFTAAITLLAVAGLLQIDERRLDLLLMMLLGEVVVVVIILLGWRLFFNATPQAAPARTSRSGRAARPRGRPLPETKGKIVRHQILEVKPKKPARLAVAPERVALTAPGFFKANARLKDRRPEWDRWLESLAGKQVIWHGTLIDVRRKDDRMLMSMSVCSVLESYLVVADTNLAGLISSFKKGDFLKVEGVFQGINGKPSIKALSVNRLDSF